ncbi:MAG: hypothetical protein N4A57_09505 [Anaeromicrobium sp.]|jgi:hypothetical protein|uniref:hypothetical protein n=1 Tax=Anaeromicrobium sp. TaxID=1929132 RepID=UPI0025FBAC96|nr:hypothetical protein [Anaeromicrobium sp.]MCT4594489.1 hypothetical protein [Anaeromicrobium sp.]
MENVRSVKWATGFRELSVSLKDKKHLEECTEVLVVRFEQKMRAMKRREITWQTARESKKSESD